LVHQYANREFFVIYWKLRYDHTKSTKDLLMYED
ncbi:MAG: hypothetical protein ACI952_002390, partial [Flavobacteriales bacterium]